jgi:hypothetical protein
MASLEKQIEEELTLSITYSGFVVIAYEIVKSMIANPIKTFYKDTIFSEGTPFRSYEGDVMYMNKKHFEAYLLYIRYFMKGETYGFNR